jgi:hypothetical protein
MCSAPAGFPLHVYVTCFCSPFPYTNSPRIAPLPCLNCPYRALRQWWYIKYCMTKATKGAQQDMGSSQCTIGRGGYIGWWSKDCSHFDEQPTVPGNIWETFGEIVSLGWDWRILCEGVDWLKSGLHTVWCYLQNSIKVFSLIYLANYALQAISKL